MAAEKRTGRRTGTRTEIPVDAREQLAVGITVKPSSERAIDVTEWLRTSAIGSRARSLTRTELESTEAVPLWIAILRHTEAIGTQRYFRFINRLFVGGKGLEDGGAQLVGYPVRPGVDAYKLLKHATEAFLLRDSGVWTASDRPAEITLAASALGSMLRDPMREELDPELAPEGNRGGRVLAEGDGDLRAYARGTGDVGTLGEARRRLGRFLSQDVSGAYIDAIVESFDDGAEEEAASPFAMLNAPLGLPCLLELLWSYWHEEGMLSQTMAAVALRFQNVRRKGGVDPLAELELNPLRPLANFLWGYVNDESNRLSVLRRAYEYQHHYGLTLYGKVTRGIRPADSRSRFLEAFHDLLRVAADFYSRDDDTTVVADAFPVLNALKELHLVLSEGAHNQFRDLPWTARAEMLMEQWMLARPEMREFLRGRSMVPYPEQWMGTVDSMKRLQGWGDLSVTHFRDLGVFGERLLLSIRHYAWIAEADQQVARTWARYWRPEIQGYIHAYRAATGVDLAHGGRVDATPPAVHLRRRLARQRRSMEAPQRVQELQATHEAVWVSQQEAFPLLPQRIDDR